MDERWSEVDEQNLQFLLNASDAELKRWYRTVGAEDHEYAAHLLNRYAGDLRRAAGDVLDDAIEAQLAAVEWTEAHTVLQRYRLRRS